MNNKWVSLWGNAIARPAAMPEHYAKNITLRYVIMPTISGDKLRLTFSNAEGYERVTLSMVTVAKTSSGHDRDVEADTIAMVTFGGTRELTLAPGEIRQSDELFYSVRRGEPLSVSFYLENFTELGSGVSTSGPLSIAYFAQGCFADKKQLPVEASKPTTNFYFLNTIDVWTEPQNHAVIAFGDSITQQSWPEQLTGRILRDDIPSVAIVRRAIGGSRVLREYTELENVHYGHKGLWRFERELALTCGVSAVIVLHGINDLIHPQDNHPYRSMADLPTADRLMDGLRCYIAAAHRFGVQIYLATITPFGTWPTYTPEKEAIRQTVNAWIRSNHEADGFVDFDAVTLYPADPKSAHPDYNSGDGLHPALSGAKRMAECIPTGFLK